MPDSDEQQPRWRVYVLRRGDGALYTGITTDVQRRLREHAGGGSRGARALRGRGPLTLVYEARIDDRATASRIESRIKRLSRRDKETLVARRPDTRALLAWLGLEAAG